MSATTNSFFHAYLCSKSVFCFSEDYLRQPVNKVVKKETQFMDDKEHKELMRIVKKFKLK